MDKEKSREKIAEFLWNTYKPAYWVDWKLASNLYLVEETLQKADEIISLLPNEGEIRKQERGRAEGIIDSFMAHGKYVVTTEEGLTMRGLSGDVEYIWNQIIKSLKEE